MDVVIKNKKLRGSIEGISSKSYAHRALFCSALAKGRSKLIIDTLSKDIINTIDVIKAMGCLVEVKGNEIIVDSSKGYRNKFFQSTGESGTSLRLAIPIFASLGIDSNIVREGSLIGRTNEVYFKVLPKHGVDIFEERQSILLRGQLKSGSYEVEGNISSQFVSGLLLALGNFKEESKIKIKFNLESKPYVDMTIDVMKKFGTSIVEGKNFYLVGGEYAPSDYIVEKDWSNALFFLIAGVEVKGLNINSKQGDKMALGYLEKLGYLNISENEVKLEKLKKAEDFRIIDARNIPDCVPALCIISALTPGLTKVKNISRLRLKESDRVSTTISMLRNLGVDVKEEENSFTFSSVESFKSCKINSYNDHRIAMAGAIAGTFSNGQVIILDSKSVEKSYINFFKDFKSLGGEYNVL